MTKGKDMDELLSERIIIPTSPQMFGEIEEFWHTRRMKSRSEAIRHLISVGLEVERKKKVK